MTRKKSRPQHRETSPKSANEGGFYKMFWNSMEGDNDASAFPPNERPANSPTVIIINDSDDENPYIIDENSGDVPFIPHPIKQEVFVDAQTSAGETVEDQSAVVQLEKTPETIEDCVSETLQPTPPVHLTESCDESINSSRLVADQTSENVVLSPNRANSPKESFPVPHDPSNAPENDIDAERTVDNYESSPLKTIIPSGSQQQENGYQCRDSEVTQVCSIFSPNQLDDPPGNGCSISLDSPTVAVENKCEGDGIPINGHLEATTNSPPVMSRTTGHDLESTQVDHPSGDGCSVSLDSAMVAIENRCEGDEISTNGNLEAITNSPPVMSVTTGQGLESNQVDEPLGNDCSVSLDSAMLSIENRCEGEEMSTNSSLEAITNSPPVMSRTTGQALELLKSLLVSPDGEASSVSTPVNTESNVDIDSSTEPRSMPIVNPLQIKREIGESQCLISNVTLSSNEPNTACLDDTASSVVQSIASHFESSAVVQPTTVTQQTQSADICKDSAADEFPAFGLVLPSKIKIESDCVKRSLDLLKNELFNFYNNCHVKIAFERKTELEIAEKSLDVLNNEEVEPRIPNGTAPCRVMMERLPTPLVRKGYVALSCKAFQTWKSRIIRLRNEEQFRHLGVWRRGRTRLWRECQLAGMDKLSYDEQVVYIKKHMIYETSSSSEADSSDDEFYNKMFDPESDNNKLHPNDLSPPALITTVHSVDTTSADDVTKSKSPLSKGKVKGSKSMKNQYRSKAINVPKTPDNDVSPCRDEYVVEQSTVHDPHSGGKKTAPLKITIRKTSVNKSEDEREKSVESEVENSFTVPLKPTNKKVKRNFVTKRTYRKLEDQVLPQPDTLIDNEQQKKRRVQPTPHYVDDNDEDEESLLGRRSYEVENFNLLEKWDIPFEEPTLFRSPRMASRLAQLKTKEAFTRKIRAQPAPQKPVLLCKEVKEVVEMLCSKTVEAMLCPDATTSAQQAPNSGTPLQIKCLVLDTPSVPLAVQSEEVPPHNIPETEDISGKTTCDEDMSETQSVTHDETNSTIDTSECGDSPMKGKIVSPVSKKRKKPKLSYRRKKAKAKPSLKTVDTPLNDEKVIELCSKVPKVLISPLQSTQVPVVSEGPGQSPQESEDDAMHPVNTEAVKNNVSANVENEKLQDALDEVDERSAEKSDHVSRVQNTLPDLPVPPVDNEKGTTTRVTRSKQPSITLDPDILENFGIRKKSKKSVDRKNTSSEDMGNEIKSTRQPVKSIPKKKGALPKKSLQEIPVEGKNSDLNTQVHEVSEGPGEVTEELSMKQLPPNIPSQDDCASVVEELENIGSGKDIRVNPNKIIPDSPMSPTPDAVEDEPVQPRMTRSKKRMMREGYAYIALKMNNSNEDGLPADEPVTKLNAETVQLEVGSSEKVSETVCETQQASLDGDKSGTGSLVDSVKTSTDIAEETVENVTALDSCPVLAEEIPVIQEKPCLETDKHLVVQPQPELVTKTSSSDVDDPSLAIAQQISVSIASLIHRPEEIGALDTITPSLPSGATQPKPPENVFTNEVSPNKTPEDAVSLVTEGSSSPVEPNTSRETKAQAVLETLNSILKLSSQNKKIADSLTSRGNINLFDKEPTIEFRNASDDECDSGDAADGLVVDEDRDFSDDDDNSADLATRIDQIIKDQIKGDTEPTGVKGLSEAETGNVKSKEIASKSRDSIDERTGLPTAFIQKLRDPRIRSKLLSRLEESDELVPNEALASLSVNRADPLKAPLNDKPSTAIRDPRTLRTVTVTRPVLATASVGVTGDQTVVRTVPLVEGGAMEPPVSRESANGAAVMRGAPNPVALSGALSPQAILRGATTTSALRAPLLPTPTSAPLLNNPRGPLLPTPTSAPLLNNPRGPLLPTPTVVPLLPTPAALLNKPRGPLLPTPTALHPMARALSNSASAVYPLSIDRTGIASTNEVVEQNKIDEDDEDEEESLKRRPKKQKKELDTELMYKSPLEDLQSEAHPTYGRQLPRVNSRSDRRNITRIERGRSKSTERRASRWDVRYNEEDHRHYPEPHPVYNQDRWGVRQMNDQVSPIPSDPHSWKPRNWHPEYNTSYLPPHPNEIVYQEPRLSYMDTKLLNLSLLPKTTNLSAPPFTKIYTYFNHSNPQILGIAPPTYDPNEKASTITMMDPMGQEMIDIVQLPRPTSGLTSDYFNDLPDEFSLEELVTHPYLALSDMMDEEIEIENHGTNIFDDSDEERRISRVNVASRRLVNDPRNRPPVLHEKTDNVKDKQPQKLTTGNPLENILHCLPALKEQYSFKKTAVDLENENSGEPIAPPPPIWSNDLDLRKKDKKPEKTRPVEANETVLKNWRNPSPPKMKPSTKTHSPTNRSRSKSPPHRKMRRRSRSKSPARRRSKSRSRSPRSRRRSRSRSPYGVRRSTRSRSSSPKYRRGRSRSSSVERLGHVRKFKRSRSRSPAYHHHPASISPSRKRHSRR